MLTPDSRKEPFHTLALGTTGSTLEEGELKLTMVKQVEPVDSYDLDIEVLLLVSRACKTTRGND